MRFSASPLPLLAALLACLTACQPTLPSPSPGKQGSGEARLRIEPDGDVDLAPRVLRVVLESSSGPVDASRVLFVRGHVGPGHVRQAKEGDLSRALTERIVPAITFDRDGAVVLAPLLPLDPGATYGVLSGDPPVGVDLHISEVDPAPLLPRVWPPPGAPGEGPFAIFCGDTLPVLSPARVDLDPLSAPGALLSGAAARIGAGCLRLDALEPDSPLDGDVAWVIPPPLIDSDGASLRLDPSLIPLHGPGGPKPSPPLECAPGEIAFGPGCARVEDDRIQVTSPDEPLLWAVRTSEGVESVRATSPLEPWVIRGLSPASSIAISLGIVDVAGRTREISLSVQTLDPRPHVILSEVLANPVGPEPDQEWVEIVNDGLAPADLEGYAVEDIGGITALPAATLAPGEYALIVNDSYVEGDDYDPAPAKGTLLLRVPKLGKTGLKNDGEPLRLLDPAGASISKMPVAPVPKPGQSLARVSPSAPDGSSDSFAAGPPTPGAAP